MIGILDYGMGNLLSVYSAFDFLGSDVSICHHPEDLNTVDKIVIPGVGAFKDCITRLKAENLIEALHENVIQKSKPTMGICLGMQVMAERSFEDGECEGLGWFEGEVIKLNPNIPGLRVPNIGWDEIDFQPNFPLFQKIPQKADLYFVHSFYLNCKNPQDLVASYTYGHKVTAAICKDNIFATQFHPEKSQDFGLQILENFINWRP